MSEEGKAHEHVDQGGRPNESFDFSALFKDEMEEIRERREKAKIDLTGLDEDWRKGEKRLSEKDREILSESLVGLALSGEAYEARLFAWGCCKGWKNMVC